MVRCSEKKEKSIGFLGVLIQSGDLEYLQYELNCLRLKIGTY